MRSQLGALIAIVLATSIPARANPVTVVEDAGILTITNGDFAVDYELASGRIYLDATGARLGPLRVEADIDALTLTAPGTTAPSYLVADVDDAIGRGKRITITAENPTHRLEIALTVREDRRDLNIDLAVLLGAAVAVDRFAVVAPATVLDRLGADARALAEAFQSWDVPALTPRRDAPTGIGLAAAYDPTNDRTLVVGGLTRRENVTVEVATGLRLEAKGPRRVGIIGERIASDTLYLELTAGQNLALESYSDAISLLTGSSGQPVPWGWMSWYALNNPDENVMAVAARELATIDAGRGQAVLLMDDLWQDRLGDWQANSKFPSGMAALAGSAHGLGLRAGLWIAPFGVAEGSQVAIDHPDWLVWSGGSPQVIETRPEWGGRIYRLDPSVAGVSAFVADLIDRVTVTWAYDLVKLDFLYWGLVDDSLTRPGTDPRAAFAACLDAINAAAKPGTTILLSGMPLAFAPGRGDAVRTSPDATGDSGRHRQAFRGAARRAHRHTAAHHADADVLMVRKTLNDADARTRTTFLAMVGGPLFLGDDFWSDPAERIAMAERLLPPHALRGRPVDLFTSDVPGSWELPLGGESRNVAGITYGFATEERRLDVSQDGQPHLLYDVWDDRLVGFAAGTVAAAVAPNDVILLTAHAAPTSPIVVATRQHYVGSVVNVTSSSWSAPDLTLELRGKPLSELGVVLAGTPTLAAETATRGRLAPRPDGLTILTIDLDGSGTAQSVVSFIARAPDPPLPTGRPTVTAPSGVRVVGEETIRDASDLAALLTEAGTGTFVVVLPPPDTPPAPARFDPAPWVEVTYPGETTAATVGTIAGDLATLLALPLGDDSGAFVNLRPGPRPRHVAGRASLPLATHGVVVVGDSALFRFGRLEESLVETAIARLGDPALQTALHDLLARAGRTVHAGSDAESLDGGWRFSTDPGDIGATRGWALPGFDDSAWVSIDVASPWESQGHPGYDGVAWYRRNVPIPAAWSGLDLVLEMDAVDDEDQTTIAGQVIGSSIGWNTPRRYRIPTGLASGGTTVTLAIRVVDNGGNGGVSSSVRLRPDPSSLAMRLNGDRLFDFRRGSDLATEPTDAVLYAVDDHGSVRLTASGGSLPFDIHRGDFPRFDNATSLANGPFAVPSTRDRPASDAAYQIVD